MSKTIQIKRGPRATMPALAQGELGMTTDSGAEGLFIGNGTENIEIARKSNLQTHSENSGIHVTADEKAAWNAKLDSFTETDPTVPAWAKADTKPTYTANEVGATPASHASNTSIHVTSNEKAAWNAKQDKLTKPDGKSYMTFSSPNNFTLKVNDTTKHWDGTLEYFASNKTWAVWDGTTTLSAVDNDGEYIMCLRGTGNTRITGANSNYKWVLTGSDIACIGNIENLLDYTTVSSGKHPTMAVYCYAYMFRDCTSLIQAPTLSATTLTTGCYYSMFYGCTSLTQVPALPATTLTNGCYQDMFYGCTSLTQVPSLPATTLAENCYRRMFYGCTSLIQASSLPATTLANYCYYNMFRGCTGLTQAPSLPATTLANYCYCSMFYGCTGLIQVPSLPATTLVNYCYSNMFQGCTSLIHAPSLPAATLADHCYNSMFYGCTSLIQASSLPATTLAKNCYYSMFYGCTSLAQIPALPATTLAENCYNSMFYGCSSLKLSSTQTGEYTQEYRIPTSSTGTTATNALNYMFTSTGGTFTGTPVINTTYYLSSDNMVVRDTEVSTLNGYVGSMIDSSIGNAAYTKAETLSDTTKTVFGLNSSAVPDDALSFIGKYNQHWWLRRSTTTGEEEIVRANDRNAYPDSGILDGYEYLEYYGVPLENAVRANGLVTNMINRTTSVDEPDTSYQTYMTRGEALFSSTTSPTANGAIAWQYS